MIKKIIIFLVGMLILSGCQGKNADIDEEISGTDYILGTIITIKISDHGTEDILQACFNRLKEIEAEMSVSIATSDIAILNAKSHAVNSGDTLDPMTVSDDTYKVLETALEFGQLSNGKFDISLGPIIDLWQIGTAEAHVPNENIIIQALSYVDYTKIKLLNNNQVLIEPGMSLDLGGIAKGYAADEVVKILKSAGVESAIINLGGNIRVLGSKTDDSAYKVGIQNPFDSRNEYIGIVSVIDKTVVTSGDYERYFYENDVKYHHVFNSETGYPHITNVAGVSIICNDSITADALSTILFLMDIEDGLEMINAMEDVDCIYITKDHQLYISNGPLVTDFKITDDTFSLTSLVN